MQARRWDGVFVWLDQPQVVVGNLVTLRTFFNRDQPHVRGLHLRVIERETFNLCHNYLLLYLKVNTTSLYNPGQPLTPNLLGNFDDQLNLSPLLVFGQLVPLFGRGKATLGR